jgi:hypothetical protein
MVVANEFLIGLGSIESWSLLFRSGEEVLQVGL